MAHPLMTHQERIDQLATATTDQLRQALRSRRRELIELEATIVIGVEPYERTAGRLTHGNTKRA